MGYEDRDYMKDERSDYSPLMPGNPACRSIIVTTVIVFIAQIFLTREPTPQDLDHYAKRFIEASEAENASQEELIVERQMLIEQIDRVSVLEQWFELDTEKVVSGGQVWRLFTSALLHDRFGVWHILINMLFLYWFGREIEDRHGSREFLNFYLAAAIFASLLFVLLQLYLGERIPAIGASGAVLAVVCLFTIYYPTHTINLFFIFPIQMRYLLWLYVIFDLHPLLLQLAGTRMYTGTAHAAHLGGLLFGFLYWRLNWHLSPISDWVWRLFSSPNRERANNRPSRQISASQESKLEADIDSILQKIHEQGESSLTEREREILNRGSEHYRKRQ